MNTENAIGDSPVVDVQEPEDSQVNAPVTRESLQKVEQYFMVRVSKTEEENERLRNRIEQMERRLTPVEEFLGKAKQVFTGFFRKSGVNIGEENKEAATKEISSQEYLSNRPEYTDEERNTYIKQLQEMNLSPEEIARRMNQVSGTMTEEEKDVAVNIDPTHQRTDMQNREISWEEYQTQRPTFQDYQKDLINQAGGITPEVVQQSAQVRDRINTQSQESVSVSGKEKAMFNRQQKRVQEGVNLDPSNQINKKEYTSPGLASDEKFGASSENLRSMANLMDQQDGVGQVNTVGVNDFS